MAGNKPDREIESDMMIRTKRPNNIKKWREINLIFIECKFTELNVTIRSYFCSVFRLSE